MNERKTLIGELPVAPPERTGWPWTEETDPAVFAGRADWPRISIVTPSFNQAPFLEETIRSVLLQNYPNLQYLVIDGGSTDGSVEIIQKYAPWIDYWVSEKDRGQSHAINKGLVRCDGMWRNWLNSDDYLLPGALRAVAEAGAVRPGVELVSGAMLGRSPTGDLQPWPELRVHPPIEDAIVNHRTSQPAMFYRADWLRAVDEDLHFAMDYDLWVRLLAASGTSAIEFVPAPVAVFRFHPESKTCSQLNRFEPEERVILRKLCAALGSSAGFLDVLAPPADGAGPGIECRGLKRRTLEKVLLRRYLHGELRSRIHQQGIRGLGRLFFQCFLVRPLATAGLAAKEIIKRRLGLVPPTA